MSEHQSVAPDASRPVVWLVLPWSPGFQGGVSGVVRQLKRVMEVSGHFRPVIVVNDWSSSKGQWHSDFYSQRLTLVADTSVRALLTSVLRAPITLYRTHKALRSQRVEAVNFHYTNHAPLSIVLLSLLGLFRGKLVISFHGTDVNSGSGAVGRWLRRVCHLRADALVACSVSLAERIASTYGIQRDRISVILNGVDGKIFHSAAEPSPELLRALPAHYLVSVGSFVPLKAHDVLVHAFANIARRYPDLHLCLAGASGPTENSIRQLAQELGVESRVHLMVGLSAVDVAGLLAKARICVQPSSTESFPLAVLEAGAVGVPLAVSGIPGHANLVTDTYTGRVFEAGSSADCGRVVEQMLEDVRGCREMAERLSRSVRTELTWESCATNYEATYGSVSSA